MNNKPFYTAHHECDTCGYRWKDSMFPALYCPECDGEFIKSSTFSGTGLLEIGSKLGLNNYYKDFMIEETENFNDDIQSEFHYCLSDISNIMVDIDKAIDGMSQEKYRKYIGILEDIYIQSQKLLNKIQRDVTK